MQPTQQEKIRALEDFESSEWTWYAPVPQGDHLQWSAQQWVAYIDNNGGWKPKENTDDTDLG